MGSFREVVGADGSILGESTACAVSRAFHCKNEGACVKENAGESACLREKARKRGKREQERMKESMRICVCKREKEGEREKDKDCVCQLILLSCILIFGK